MWESDCRGSTTDQELGQSFYPSKYINTEACLGISPAFACFPTAPYHFPNHFKQWQPPSYCSKRGEQPRQSWGPLWFITLGKGRSKYTGGKLLISITEELQNKSFCQNSVAKFGQCNLGTWEEAAELVFHSKDENRSTLPSRGFPPSCLLSRSCSRKENPLEWLSVLASEF